jgi:hypothetical protein
MLEGFVGAAACGTIQSPHAEDADAWVVLPQLLKDQRAPVHGRWKWSNWDPVHVSLGHVEGALWPRGSVGHLRSDATGDTTHALVGNFQVVGTGVDPVTSRFSGARSTN